MRLLKSNNKKYCFIMDMEVRDYELDCEQIVNNEIGRASCRERV